MRLAYLGGTCVTVTLRMIMDAELAQSTVVDQKRCLSLMSLVAALRAGGSTRHWDGVRTESWQVYQNRHIRTSILEQVLLNKMSLSLRIVSIEILPGIPDKRITIYRWRDGNPSQSGNESTQKSQVPLCTSLH